LLQLTQNPLITQELEDRKINDWDLNEEYVKILYQEIMDSDIYAKYMNSDTNSYEADKKFIIDLYKNIIAPNDKLYEYIEDVKLTWLDDLPLVNTYLVKQFKKVKKDSLNNFFLPKLFKDNEDKEFTSKLLKKTLLNNEKLLNEIANKTENWDKDRIAHLDSILLQMGISELLYFPSIPTKVTMNEYLEIAKEYSTPKSSIFINGILDKLVKEYTASKTLNKMGRGLL
jgi:N utilization substance protein B